MFDTILQKQSYEIDQRYWLDIGFRRTTRDPHLMVYNDSTAPRLTVTVRRGISHLSAEYSIPKLIHGHNAILPVSREESLDAVSTACERTSMIIGKRFDGREIRRIDYARDYPLGGSDCERVWQSLHGRLIPKMKRSSFEGTHYWHRPERRWTCQICIYEKLPQMLAQHYPEAILREQAIAAAAGKIRFEVRMRGTALNRLHRIAGGKTAQHLVDPGLSNSMITEFEKKLDFERIISARQVDFFAAAESAGLCTNERGTTRFIHLVQSNGPDFYKNPAFNWPKRTYYHYRTKCVNAGFWDELVSSSAVQIA